MYGVAVAKIKLLCSFLFCVQRQCFQFVVLVLPNISENNAPSLWSSLDLAERN